MVTYLGFIQASGALEGANGFARLECAEERLLDCLAMGRWREGHHWMWMQFVQIGTYVIVAIMMVKST